VRGASAAATKNSLEKVAEEFYKEVTAELEEGRAQALESLEGVGRETSEAVAKIIEAGNKQAESLTRQITGSAELRSRNLQLRAIEEAVGEVFELAMAKVAKASPAEYEKAITHLLTEGVEFIGPEARVGCGAKDKKVVSAVIKKLNHGSTKLTLDDEDVRTIGGLVLTSSDGTVRFDNTFEARLERLRPMLRREVAGLLAGGEA
jgi:V/A-type H+-transporting ATPase subunit E